MAQTTNTALVKSENSPIQKTPPTCSSCESLLFFRIIFDEYQRELAGRSAREVAKMKRILDGPAYSGTMISDLEYLADKAIEKSAAQCATAS